MTETGRRSFLHERKREKESHLQDPFNQEKKVEKKESRTLRASVYAAQVVEDVKYTERHKSATAALDKIIQVYEKYKHLEKE